MDLIDKNKLDSFKYRSASERMDLPVDYMVGWNDAVDGIMANAPTVEAIPVEYIESTMNRWKGIIGYEESVDALRILIDNWKSERTEE